MITKRKLNGNKKRAFLVCALLFLCSCAYAPYRYSFELIGPYEKELKYEDGLVSFTFMPSVEFIWIYINNKSENDIYVNLDKVEYIGPLGEVDNILFGWKYATAMNEFTQNGNYISPVTIFPKSSIEGNMWINVWPGPGADIGDSWTTVRDSEIEYLIENILPEFPFEGDGLGLKDSTFNLIVPIEISGNEKNYEFTFMITNVEVLDSNSN